MAACGAEFEDTSDIVNELLTIDGVKVAALFKGIEGDKVKLSLRSKGPLDVNRIAQSFGGGGHTNASGAVIPGTIEEVAARVLAACRNLVRPGA